MLASTSRAGAAIVFRAEAVDCRDIEAHARATACGEQAGLHNETLQQADAQVSRSFYFMTVSLFSLLDLEEDNTQRDKEIER